LFATKPNNNSPLCIYHPTSNTHSSEECSLNPTNRSKTKKEETGRISSSNKSNNNQHSNTSQNSSNKSAYSTAPIKEKEFWCSLCNQSGKHSTEYCYKNPNRKISQREKLTLKQEHANAIRVSDLPDDHPIKMKQQKISVNWVKQSHETTSQTHFTFNLQDGQQFAAIADTGATASLIPITEAHRLRLKIDQSTQSTLVGANNLPINTVGTVQLPMDVKGQKKTIKAYISPDPRAPAILGLNFLQEFRLTLAFDGINAYLTDALRNYDFEKECCITGAKQLTIAANINYLVNEQTAPEYQFKGPPPVLYL